LRHTAAFADIWRVDRITGFFRINRILEGI